MLVLSLIYYLVVPTVCVVELESKTKNIAGVNFWNVQEISADDFA